MIYIVNLNLKYVMRLGMVIDKIFYIQNKKIRIVYRK